MPGDLEKKEPSGATDVVEEVEEEDQATKQQNAKLEETGAQVPEDQPDAKAGALTQKERFENNLASLKASNDKTQQQVAKNYEESLKRTLDLAEQKEKLVQEQKRLEAAILEAQKQTKSNAALVSAEKKTLDLGLSRILNKITKEELDEFERENCLKVLYKDKSEKEFDPDSFIKECFGKEFKDEVGLYHKNPSTKLSGPDIALANILLHAFLGQFKELKAFTRKLAEQVMEVVDQHNKVVDAKLTEIQSKPSYAKVAGSGKAEKKQMEMVATQVFKKQLKAHESDVAQHNKDRRKTILQIMAVRIPMCKEAIEEKNPKKSMELEIGHFLKFVNTKLAEFATKKHPTLVHRNNIQSVKRLEWPDGSDGKKFGWDKRLLVTFSPGKEGLVASLIQHMNEKVAITNHKIHLGELEESQRVHRYIQVQLTDYQKKQRRKIQEWCNRTNALNRQKNPKSWLWLIFYEENGDPFKRFCEDRHPERTKELERYWKQFLPGGSKDRRRKKKDDNGNEETLPPKKANNSKNKGGGQGKQKQKQGEQDKNISLSHSELISFRGMLADWAEKKKRLEEWDNYDFASQPNMTSTQDQGQPSTQAGQNPSSQSNQNLTGGDSQATGSSNRS